MKDYTHDVSGAYFFNEQVVFLKGKAKVDQKNNKLEMLLSESDVNREMSLLGDIVYSDDRISLDIIERINADVDRPIINYRINNRSAKFEGEFSGERNSIFVQKPTNEMLDTMSMDELIENALSHIEVNGKKAVLYFNKRN